VVSLKSTEIVLNSLLKFLWRWLAGNLPRVHPELPLYPDSFAHAKMRHLSMQSRITKITGNRQIHPELSPSQKGIALSFFQSIKLTIAHALDERLSCGPPNVIAVETLA
jgi:hypothetical protein